MDKASDPFRETEFLRGPPECRYRTGGKVGSKHAEVGREAEQGERRITDTTANVPQQPLPIVILPMIPLVTVALLSLQPVNSLTGAKEEGPLSDEPMPVFEEFAIMLSIKGVPAG